MTEAIYLEVTERAEAAHKAKRRVSVSGMLKILGVSRSGYRAWLKHVPSNAEKRRESVKAKIKDILKFATEIGVSCGDCPRLYPLSLNAHLFHVLPNSTLRNSFSCFA